MGAGGQVRRLPGLIVYDQILVGADRVCVGGDAGQAAVGDHLAEGMGISVRFDLSSSR
jgi:hypothetical protein